MTLTTDLTKSGVEVSAVGLSIIDPALSFEDYEQILYEAGKVHTSAKWWIGDLLIFGEARYGERYAQAMDATGLSYSTLTKYRYVCSRVLFSRRRKELRFSHHAEVASFEPDEQNEWLDRVKENGWSVEELREKIRTAKSLAGEPPPTPKKGKVEVVDAVSVVDAARNLSTIREALVTTNGALQGGDVDSLPEQVANAMRALDETGETIRRAAAGIERRSLTDVARKVVANATLSGGFYMIETTVYEEFAAIVAEDPDGRSTE